MKISHRAILGGRGLLILVRRKKRVQSHRRKMSGDKSKKGEKEVSFFIPQEN